MLLGACFLVNYVTADAKTNWAEGFVLLTFYIMIVRCSIYFVSPGLIVGVCRCCVLGSTPESPLLLSYSIAQELYWRAPLLHSGWPRWH